MWKCWLWFGGLEDLGCLLTHLRLHPSIPHPCPRPFMAFACGLELLMDKSLLPGGDTTQAELGLRLVQKPGRKGSNPQTHPEFWHVLRTLDNKLRPMPPTARKRTVGQHTHPFWWPRSCRGSESSGCHRSRLCWAAESCFGWWCWQKIERRAPRHSWPGHWGHLHTQRFLLWEMGKTVCAGEGRGMLRNMLGLEGFMGKILPPNVQ